MKNKQKSFARLSQNRVEKQEKKEKHRQQKKCLRYTHMEQEFGDDLRVCLPERPLQSRLPATFSGHKSCETGDINFSYCHVIPSGHVVLEDQ